MTYLDLLKFEELVEQKYIRKNYSPCGQLVQYTYTEQCEYDRHWNEYTNQARGIILNKDTGKIVALPFKKFHNLGAVEETYLSNLPDLPYIVTEKMDGSLGIVYYWNDKWNVATKGSFTSDQAKKAEEILFKNYKFEHLDKKHTYLAEIIYPENKIVVNYGQQEKLVLLMAFDILTGLEVHRNYLQLLSDLTKMPIVQQYFNLTIKKMIELQSTLPKDEEGFVVRYENGLRLKIKGEEYLKVHRMISYMTPLSFWEAMEKGKVPKTYLEQLPEEFRAEFEPIVTKLEDQYKWILAEIEHEFAKVITQTFPDSAPNKRDVAIFIQDSKLKHKSAMFSTLQGKRERVIKYIMDAIRPDGNAFKELL